MSACSIGIPVMILFGVRVCVCVSDTTLFTSLEIIIQKYYSDVVPPLACYAIVS